MHRDGPCGTKPTWQWAQCSPSSLPGGLCWGGAVPVTLARTCSAELLSMVCPGAWGCTSPGAGPCIALG